MKKFIKLSLIPLLLTIVGITLVSCGDPKPKPDPQIDPVQNAKVDNGYLPTEADKLERKKYQLTYLPKAIAKLNEIGAKFMKDKPSVTIRFAHNFGKDSQKVLKEIIDDFHAKYPYITVTPDAKDGSYTDLKDANAKDISAGTQANVTTAYPDHIESYNKVKENILDLNPFVGSDYGFDENSIKDFIPSFYNEGLLYTRPGMFSLPFAKSTEAIYYNKDFFKAHNLTMPEDPTWDDILQLTIKIKIILSKDSNYQTTAGGKTTINKYPLTIDSSDNLFITSAFQKNGPYTHLVYDKSKKTRVGVINFNDEKLDNPNKEFLSFFKDMIVQNLLVTRAETGKFGSTYFVDQNAIMSIGSTGGAKYNDPETQSHNSSRFEVGVAKTPQFDPAHPKRIMQGPDLALFDAHDDNKNFASWLFIKYLTSTEVTAKWAINNGYSPIRKSSFETPAFKAFITQTQTQSLYKIIQATQKLYEQITPDSYFTTVAFPKSPDVRSKVGLVLHTLATDDKYKDLTGDKLYDAIQEVLDDAYTQIVKNS